MRLAIILLLLSLGGCMVSHESGTRWSGSRDQLRTQQENDFLERQVIRQYRMMGDPPDGTVLDINGKLIIRVDGRWKPISEQDAQIR